MVRGGLISFFSLDKNTCFAYFTNLQQMFLNGRPRLINCATVPRLTDMDLLPLLPLTCHYLKLLIFLIKTSQKDQKLLGLNLKTTFGIYKHIMPRMNTANVFGRNCCITTLVKLKKPTMPNMYLF